MLRALEAADTCNARLEIHCQSFEYPAWLVEIGEQEWIATEDRLADAPDAPTAIEVEDVGELVRHDQRVPVFVITQTFCVGWRVRVNDDAIRRIHCRVTVDVVYVIGDHEIDRPAGRSELHRELSVGALGVYRGATRRLLERRCKVNSEMSGVQRSPVSIGGQLPGDYPCRAGSQRGSE